MLRPGYRLLGGCYFDGDTAVRCGRLRSTRKVISAKNHERESREEDRQLGFAKDATKTEPQREMFVRQYANRYSEKEVQLFGLPPRLDGRPADTRTVQQRFSFAVVDFTSKEASKEPITTCMTLFGGTCCCRYL